MGEYQPSESLWRRPCYAEAASAAASNMKSTGRSPTSLIATARFAARYKARPSVAARVKSVDFHFVQGEELISYYESAPGNHRGFCRICGSPIITRHDRDASSYGIALGTLDDDPGVKPMAHVHVASKAPWFDIAGDLPQFAELPK